MALHPFAVADAPSPTMVLDAMAVVYDGTIPHDVRYFESLHRSSNTSPGWSVTRR
jgi:hypothetical protein